MRRSTHKFENRENLEILQNHVQLLQNLGCNLLVWYIVIFWHHRCSIGKDGLMSGLGIVNK